MLFLYLSFLSFFTVENDTRSYLFILSSLLEAIFIYALYEQSKRILLKFFAIILSVIYILVAQYRDKRLSEGKLKGLS
jgi:hypothetical protein